MSPFLILRPRRNVTSLHPHNHAISKNGHLVLILGAHTPYGCVKNSRVRNCKRVCRRLAKVQQKNYTFKTMVVLEAAVETYTRIKLYSFYNFGWQLQTTHKNCQCKTRNIIFQQTEIGTMTRHG